MMLLGERLTAQEAEADGTALVVAAQQDLLPQALGCAHRIAALDPEAVRDAVRITARPEREAALDGYRQELVAIGRALRRGWS